jgi:predicted CoA-binding protein
MTSETSAAVRAGMATGGLSLLGRELLATNRRVTIVGLSPDPSRPSYRAAVHMLAYGYDVVPVNPTVAEVLGRRSYPSLADVPGPVGIVDIFRRVEDVPRVVGEALALDPLPAAIWVQLGLVSPAAAALAASAGVPYVEDRCIKMEHCRWFGGLNWVGLSTGVVSSRREVAHRAS